MEPDPPPAGPAPGLVALALATALVAALLGWALTRSLREPDAAPVDRIELPAPHDPGAGGGTGGGTG